MNPDQNVAPKTSGDQVIQPQASTTPTNSPTPNPPSPTPQTQLPQELFAKDPSPFKPPSTGKKKWFILGGSLAAILLIGGLYLFLIFLPSRPQAVWNTSLNRSGQAIDKLVNNATEQQTIDAFKKSKISIKLDGSGAGANYSGTFDTKFDDTKADGSLTIKAEQSEGDESVELVAKFLSEFKNESKYPTIYFQVTGLASFGLDTYAPGLESYDGKWVAIDESYWKTLNVTPEQLSAERKKEITSEDIATSAREITKTTSAYVLTSNPDKAVFEQKKFIGKEKVDGLNTYHYQVGINKQHAKDFCSAIVTTSMNTPVYKKLAGNDNETVDEQSKNDTIKECQDSVDKDIDDNDTFDLWMDSKYKLVYKARFTENNKPNTYVDIGQNYKGDNQVSLFTNYYNDEDKNEVKSSVQTDIKSHKTTGNLEFKGGEGDEAYNVKLTLEAKPYTGDIEVTEPAGAIPFQQVLKDLGF